MSPKKPSKSSRSRKAPPAKVAGPSPRLAAIRAAAERLPQRPATTYTYFLLISKSEPTGRRFKRLHARSLLAWFQRVWHADPGSWKSELGGHVYGLNRLADRIEELKLARPASADELLPLLKKHIYYERHLDAEPHFVHVQTDDDEVDVNYYFFDDEFLRTPGAFDRLPWSGAGRSAAHGDELEDDAYAVLLRDRPD